MIFNINEITTIEDLEIRTCIPDCNSCPGQWINSVIHHKIICKCPCKHTGHKNSLNKRGRGPEPRTLQTDEDNSLPKEMTLLNESS